LAAVSASRPSLDAGEAPLESGDAAQAGRPGPSRPLRDLLFRFPIRYRVVWVALALFLILVEATTPATLGATSMRLVTALAGVLFLASVGQLLIVMVGGLDITVAAMMTLAAGIVVRESQGANDKLWAAVVAVAVTTIVIGLVKALLVVFLKLNALIVTLAMNGIITGGTIVWTGVTFSTTGAVPPSLHHFSAETYGPLSVVGLVALAVGVVVAAFLRSTSPGRNFVAVGTNPVAARIIGIRVALYRAVAYVVAGLFFAAAGILLAGFLGSPDLTLGSPYLLLTFVTVALGGAALSGGPSSVLGIAASSLFLALLDQYLTLQGIGGGAPELLQGIVLVLAVGAIALGTTGRHFLQQLVRELRQGLGRAGPTESR
jgi:ribose transport system permease protein